MAQYSLCLALVSVCTSVIADLSPAEYAALLTMPPYRSFRGFPRPDIITAEIDNELQQLAADYLSVGVQNMYQWFALMQTQNVPVDQAMAMIRQLAPQVHMEKTYGMFTTPYLVPKQQFVAPMLKSRSMVRIFRREPVEGLVQAIADDTKMNVGKAYDSVKDGLSSAYDNVMEFANRVAPETTAATKNVISSLVGSPSPSNAPSLYDMLESNVRYMLADN